MHESRLLTGIAALFAGMTAILAVLGVAYNPLILVVAVVFAGVTYLLWTHGTGRLAARMYRRVEQQAAANAAQSRRRADREQGRRRTVREERNRRAQTDGVGTNFGAGPKEAWEGPRAEQRRRERARRERAQRQRARQGTAPSTSDRPSMAEAFDTLGLDSGADRSEVKAAYREKVKEVHPDTDGGDEERFKRVNRAYERLTEE